MAIQAEVVKSGNENPLATIRKFSRRVQGAGLVKQLRARRYHSRDASKTVRKKRALKLLKRRNDYRKAIKDGKIAEPTRRYQPRESSPRLTSGGGLGEATPIAR
jgi:ribosomal protein S21